MHLPVAVLPSLCICNITKIVFIGHERSGLENTEYLRKIFFQTIIQVSRGKSLFIIWTRVLQDTQTVFTLLGKMAAGCYFELVWKVTAPLESQERKELIPCGVLTSPAQGTESKEVCSGRTQDTGWHVLLDSCLEGRGYRSLHSLACQHQDFEFDTSSHGQLDAYISSVCACLCVLGLNRYLIF